MPVDSKSSVKPITAIIEELKATFPQGVRVDLGQSGAGASAAIRGLRHDSRKVSSGDAFFCIEGQKYDGNLFVKDAVDKGASLVISEKAPPADADINVPFVVVPDVRQALAAVSDYFFDRPSKRMRLIGVTGTNGKTTTTHMVEHIFQSQGTRVGLIGTLGARWTHADAGRDYQDLKFTTPQASDLQELLNTMANDGVSHVAMEVSSHALALKRVEKCEFAVACLTNVSQDHLDFHKTMEHYWKSKRILFEQLTAGSQTERAAVINLDDALANDFLKAVGKDVRAITYGWNETADVRAVKADFDFTGTRLELATPYGALKLKLKLNGVFNVYNAMSALSIVLNEGVDKETAKEAIESFEGVAGRFEVVRLAQPEDGEIDEPLCLVDYAHTPDGLDNVLRAARKLVPAGGKLIV
ncbi:MAG TPA: UDP-N-acetylmuramoyl-L-alanyl-D-glutamate--2,6-diaminopimelate ligase, partial [Candidatus Obscuribacterales bacterium]